MGDIFNRPWGELKQRPNFRQIESESDSKSIGIINYVM